MLSEIKEENNNEVAAPARPAPVKSRHPMEAFLKTGSSAGFLRMGEIVEGAFFMREGNRVFVDLGASGTGIVYGREYYAAQDVIKNLKPGDVISAKVVEPDNEEGYVELSLKEAGEERRWVDLKTMMDRGEILELPVLEANRGGLILEFKGVKGFLPASQLSSQHYPRVEGGDKEKIYQELQKLAGEILKVKILDFDPKEAKLIFTERGQTSDEMLKILSKYKIGDEVEGEITGIVDFGAFIKFDDEAGPEGLIHISEIDWSLIENPRDVLSAGDKVKAKIIDIQGDKVSLSLKQLKEDPWKKISEKYHKGDTLKGRVTKFNPFGAFVEIEAGIQGLVHISEFGTESKMKEELALGNEYQFKVLLIDPVEHRMSLGMIREKVEAEERR